VHLCCNRKHGVLVVNFAVASAHGAAEKTWGILQSAIKEIHNQNASGLSFEELYR
jgi:phosphoglycerate dehydrogenase-like enzyme